MLRRALFLLLLAVTPAEARIAGVLLDQPVALPAFTLEDHDGKPFTERSLPGRWTLLALGFTNCPDVCPVTLSDLEAARAELSTTTTPERLPRILFLAVDPARDRPVLRAYTTRFHPDFLGVTGDPGAIARLADGLDAKLRIGPPDATGAYEVAHSAAVSVIDPEGRLVAKLSPPFDPAETAAFLTGLARARLRGESRPAAASLLVPPAPAAAPAQDHAHSHAHDHAHDHAPGKAP